MFGSISPWAHEYSKFRNWFTTNQKKMKTIGKLYFIEPVNDGKEDKSLYRQRAGGEYHLLVLPFLDIYQLKVLLVLAP